MKTYNRLKSGVLLVALIIFVLGGVNIVKASGDELLPDQNPNYKISLDKYMAAKDELIKYSSLTIQNTYKAIDDVAIKKEKKEARKKSRVKARRDRKMARIENRGRDYNYSSYDYYQPYYGHRYNNNYRDYNYYGYNYRPYQGYSQNYYQPYYSSYNVSSVASTALLGMGLYWWLH